MIQQISKTIANFSFLARRIHQRPQKEMLKTTHIKEDKNQIFRLKILEIGSDWNCEQVIRQGNLIKSHYASF